MVQRQTQTGLTGIDKVGMTRGAVPGVVLGAVLGVVLMGTTGCGGPSPETTGTERASPPSQTVTPTVSPVANTNAVALGLGDVQTLVASATTLAWLDNDGLVHRATRSVVRCGPSGWVPFGQPVAASHLFDVDDEGTIYVFAGEAQPGALTVSATPTGESTVFAVDVDDVVSEVVYAGRGVWTFGVARDGSGLWVSACGPTGIFHRPAADDVPVWQDLEMMPSPSTSWQLLGGVIDAEGLFWSLNERQGENHLEAYDAAGLRHDVALTGAISNVRPCGADVCVEQVGADGRAVLRVQGDAVVSTTILPTSTTSWAVAGAEVLVVQGAPEAPVGQ